MNNKEKILAAREKKNKGFLHTSFEMETSTHFPMLIKAVAQSEGPILELGSGIFSTPLLHWLCHSKQRQLVTIEHYEHYLEFAKKFETAWHHIVLMNPYAKVTADKPEVRYGVVFVDHSPKKPLTRGDDALLFKDSADFIVLHDAGPTPNSKYGYEKIYSAFKYVYHWTDVYPHTTVVSNFKEIQL